LYLRKEKEQKAPRAKSCNQCKISVEIIIPQILLYRKDVLNRSEVVKTFIMLQNIFQ